MIHLHRSARPASKTCCAVALLLASAVLIVGCSSPAGGNRANSNAAASTTAKTPQGTGMFKPLYAPVKNPEYVELQDTLKKGRVLEDICDNLNKTVALPVDITISLDECGTVNAFYDPGEKRVHLCYELIEHFAKAFQPDAKSEDELAKAIDGATTFVFYH